MEPVEVVRVHRSDSSLPPREEEPTAVQKLNFERNKFLVECICAKKASVPDPAKGLQYANRVYTYIHGFANDLVGVLRSARKLSEIWHTFSNGITFAFNATKFISFGSTPGDIAELVDDVKGVIKAEDPIDKVTHASGIIATSGNIFVNTWTFVQGLDTVAKISQPALHFFDVLGPVGWGMSVCTLIKSTPEIYKDSKVLDAINVTTPLPAEAEDVKAAKRFEMFKIFLLDEKGFKIKHSVLMNKLRLMDRLPGTKKNKIRDKVEAIANGYLVTGNREITNEFVGSVRTQYRMNKLFFAFKAISVLAGLGALLFFYLPGMNHLAISNHAAWSCLILSGTIGVASVGAIKINSMLFLRDLDLQIKKHEDEVQFLEAMLKSREQAHAQIRLSMVSTVGI